MRGPEAVRHFREYQELGNEVIGSFERVQERIGELLRRNAEETEAAVEELAGAYLPTLDAASVARAEALTGFRGFSRRKPLEALAHEARVLQGTIAKVVGDERYRRREYLVGPQGELTRALAERQDMLATWQQECDRFEELNGFLDLIQLGYDTPDFQEAWYQASYWKHWAQGDAICEVLGMGDFGDDVLPAYEKVRVPRDQWKAQVDEAAARVDAIHALVQQHDEAQARIPELPRIYLKQCHKVLGGFLKRADIGLLDDWLEESGGDRAILMMLRRLAGLRAKADVLTEMRDQGIKAKVDALRSRQAKHRRKAAKYARPKHAYTTLGQRDTDPKFRPKAQKMLVETQKLHKQLDRIERFDDYERFDLGQDPELWYVAMTRKRPSKYTPRLRAWYERNPGITPVFDDEVEPEEDHTAAVAMAAGLIDRHDSGYLS